LAEAFLDDYGVRGGLSVEDLILRELFEDLLETTVLLNDLLLPLMPGLRLEGCRLLFGCGLQAGRGDLHVGQQVILILLTSQFLIVIRDVPIQNTGIALDARCSLLQTR